MCLILFGYRTQPDLPLIVAANRDEFHGRASATADFWSDAPHVLAGRDLEAGGTWLGCTTSGRFAALTNFSGPQDAPTTHTRGKLVSEFLQSQTDAQSYAHAIHGPDFAGFNLLLFDGESMVCTSNKSSTDVLTPGFYGLSNAELGAEWPKCVNGAAGLKTLTSDTGVTHDQLIALLGDRAIPTDEQLPHRGRPLEMERRIASCFIVGDEYGTRASTVMINDGQRIAFTEQSYVSGGQATDRVSYDFEITSTT